MQRVGSLNLDLPGEDMYLMDGKAVVLGRSYYYGYYGDVGVAAGEEGDVEPAPWLTNVSTFDVYVVDTTDPAAPALRKKYSFEGELVTSRMIGSKLFVVFSTYPDITEVVKPQGVQNAEVEEVLPQFRTVTGDEEYVAPAVDWANVYHPVNADGYNMITIATIETADLEKAPASTAVMADYGVVYASPQALYVTSTNYDYTGAAREFTEVHKFDLTGESARYVASGKVPGWPLNQFSLGEKDGFLRTASTQGWSGGWMPQQSENFVTVLEQVDGKLEVAGQIDGIAPGEQLYAARFVGDRGFLVTFVQIDPLFTVDLSNPREPKIAGELKVPGFSTYIHPLGENHILTIGKDADDQGDFAWFGSLSLSIFDVTDFANPTLLHRELVGVRGTGSEALYNHKAITFHNDLLALPVDLYEGDYTVPGYGEHSFSGLMVYRFGVDSGFEQVGRIETVDWSAAYYLYSSYHWTRGVFIDDNVYAVSNASVQSAAVENMDTILSTVELDAAD